MGLYCPGTLPEFGGKVLEVFDSRSLDQMDNNISCSNFHYDDGHTNICKSAGLHQVFQKRIYARVLG